MHMQQQHCQAVRQIASKASAQVKPVNIQLFNEAIEASVTTETFSDFYS